MKVKILRSVLINGGHVEKGSIVDIEESIFENLKKRCIADEVKETKQNKKKKEKEI